MKVPFFVNLNLRLVPPGGSTQDEQVWQVDGQDSETPISAQRLEVSLRATQMHDLVMVIPLEFLNLILKVESTQVLVLEEVGEAVGEAVGETLGALDGLLLGCALGFSDFDGLLLGCALGDGEGFILCETTFNNLFQK